MNDEKGYLDDLLRFLSSSPTAAHAVAKVSDSLLAAGFRRVDEREAWDLVPGDGFFVTRSASSLIAGRLGTGREEKHGFRIVGAHTDSPGLRVKPQPQRRGEGLTRLGVEVYGSPILATWFDRDLSAAGYLVVREDDRYIRILFDLGGPLCRIATPALHIHREMNTKGFKINPEKHLPPILGGPEAGYEDLVEMAADRAGVDGSRVVLAHAELYDPQPATVGGLDGSLLLGGRIDNLAMCHAAVKALEASESATSSQIICLFDSEEVGSRTLNGADSTFLQTVLERIAGSRESLLRSLSSSLLVSADGAHAVHPAYADKHDPQSRPVLNGGPVIKINAKQRYISSASTTAYFKDCVERAGFSCQYFVSRNDLRCGTTIGPLTASRLGVPGVDAGNPMISMHSIREMAGTSDHGAMIGALREHLGSGATIEP
ncbi:M18 family aminopeptidase [Candidatus Fermentibacteria bacterium]|nr:M18 family aminopeptidase [Candidatus Fermentibacteria bacterium]